MNLKNVTKDTWVRIIVLFLVLVNLISTSMFGVVLLPFAEESLYQGVSVLLTIIVTFWTTWKNNSFTKEAQAADRYLKNLKQEEYKS